MKPTESQRKLLTELIGSAPILFCKRGWCDEHDKPCRDTCQYVRLEYRTFLAPDDIFKVKEVLVEKGLWRDFEEDSWSKWFRENEKMNSCRADYINWLDGKDADGDYRFCGLVVEFKGKENL